ARDALPRPSRYRPTATSPASSIFFFFTVPPPSGIYTLSLHDALPISARRSLAFDRHQFAGPGQQPGRNFAVAQPAAGKIARTAVDRKSTRLNSSHSQISYAVFCLKKKKT